MNFLPLSFQAFPGVRLAPLNNVIAQGMNPKKKHEVGYGVFPPSFCSSYIFISLPELSGSLL